MTDDPTRRGHDLPDDLLEIAASIPPVPRGLGVLRQTLALLPEPLMARTQGSFPADELVPPEGAGQQLGTQPGAESIGPGSIADGAVGSGAIRDGALKDVAVFAATIRPVIIVPSLPALPDPDFPPGAAFVYNLGDVPPTLYKNEANVWVKLIGASDVQANSLTAGQIAAGAISTSELAIGARLVGEFANEAGATPGVFADSAGMLIRSGKLTFQDEFGLTTLFASGFTGSWFDFVTLGLYNARFSAGNVGVALSGRTANCPYWFINTSGGIGAATLQTVSDKRHLQARWTALGTWSVFSDKVPVAPKDLLELSWVFGLAVFAGSLTIQPRIYWYKEDGSASSTTFTVVAGEASSVSVSTARGPSDVVEVPLDAAFAVVDFTFTESGAHHANNTIRLFSASLMRKGSAAFIQERVADAGKFDVGPAAGTFDNYTLGAAGRSDTATLVAIDPNGGPVVLTGIAAPRHGKRLMTIVNRSLAYHIQLKHEDAGSTAENRFSLPEGQHLDIPFQGAVVLYYDDIAERWTIVSATTTSPSVRATTGFSINNGGTATFANKRAEFIKVGFLVHFRLTFQVTAAGSGGSTVTCTSTGFPFAASNARILGDRGGVGVSPIVGRWTNGGAEFDLTQMHVITAAGLSAAITGADLANGQVYSFHGTYLVV